MKTINMFDTQDTIDIIDLAITTDTVTKDVAVVTTQNRHEVTNMNDEERQLFFEDYAERTGQHHDMDFIVEKVADGKDDRFSEIAEDIEPSHFARFDEYQLLSPEEIADTFARDLTILADTKSTSRG